MTEENAAFTFSHRALPVSVFEPDTLNTYEKKKDIFFFIGSTGSLVEHLFLMYVKRDQNYLLIVNWLVVAILTSQSTGGTGMEGNT